jgi:predicted transcriptional regulator
MVRSMVSTITIDIPEDLYARLQAVLEHIDLNSICQQAIQQSVVVEESKIAEKKDIPEILDELNSTLAQHDHEYHDQETY